MKVRIWTNQLIHILDIRGDISLVDANLLKDLLIKMIEKKAERFIINAEHVDSIDSSGVGAFVFMSSTLKKLNLPLAIANLPARIKQIIDQVRLTGYFQIYDNLTEAIQALSRD